MRKICLFAMLLLLHTSLFAAGIKFLHNPSWSTVLERAKKEGKPIFIDAYAVWCAPCKQMDAETFSASNVATYYNANYINVKYDMEKGEGLKLAARYNVNAYPNLLFLSPNGDLLHRGIGFLAAADFLQLGAAAKNPATQYYTLKAKALQLSNSSFLSFAKMADALQDDDFDEIATSFLASKADLLADADLVDLLMKYVLTLPKASDIDYLMANKSKITSAGTYSVEDFDERIVSIAVQHALSKDVQKQSDIDFVAFNNTLERYIPKRAYFVYHYFRAQYFLENNNAVLAKAEFDFIIDYPTRSGYTFVANTIMSLAPVLFEESDLEHILTKFEAIPLPANEGKAYLKAFVPTVVYLKSKQTDKFITLANQMLNDEATPEGVKADLRLALKNFQPSLEQR